LSLPTLYLDHCTLQPRYSSSPIYGAAVRVVYSRRKYYGVSKIAGRKQGELPWAVANILPDSSGNVTGDAFARGDFDLGTYKSLYWASNSVVLEAIGDELVEQI